MKRFKKISALLMLSALLVTSTPMQILATEPPASTEIPDDTGTELPDDTGTELPDDTEIETEIPDEEPDQPKVELDYYTQLMSTPVARYLLTCQPDSALILNSSVTLTEDDLSPNYHGGVVDLPRLSVDYYYAVNTSTGYHLGATVYPTLCWDDEAMGQSVSLNIKTHATKKTVATITINNSNNLHGIDYYYPDRPNEEEGIPEREFIDASAYAVSELYRLVDGMRYYKTDVGLYDAKLHKNSIVMPGYMYTAQTELESSEDVEFSEVKFADVAYVFKRKEISGSGNTTSYNIKDYLGTLDGNQGLRTGLLFGGSKIEDCTYDTNTGDCDTVIKSTDLNPLYSFIAINSKCYFYELSTDTVNTDIYSEINPEAPTATWEAEKYYSLQSGAKQNEVGFDQEVKEGYMEFGPVSYDAFWKYAVTMPFSVTNRSDMYWFCHHNENSVNNMNVFAESLIYDGCIPNVATVNLKAIPKTLTIKYNYIAPEQNENQMQLYKTVEYTMDQSGAELEALPEIENYTVNAWYTDPTMSTKFDWENVLWEQNGTLNLYGEYVYSGGRYTVTYYNDVTGAKTTEEYRVIDKPVLPENPEPKGGYSFKCWQLIDDYSQDAGVSYNPDTFKPENNQSYIFKTAWDVKGIIVRVLTSKVNYYVGEQVNKDLLQVIVQNSSDVNDTRQLSADEFTMSDPTVTKEGKNQFTVTYTETGATATCEVNGIAVIMTELSVVYSGGDTVIGTELKPEQFTVKLVYNDGHEVETKDYTMDPKIIEKVGDNNITITHASFTQTIVIKGVEPEVPDSAVPASLKAEYVGKQIKAGQSISANDLSVVVTFKDGSTRTLTSNEFKFSPGTFSVPGTQNITVTYDGLTTSCKINVKEDSYQESDVVITPTPSPSTPSTPSTGGSTPSTPSTPSKPSTGGSTPSTPSTPSIGGGSSSNDDGGNIWDDLFGDLFDDLESGDIDWSDWEDDDIISIPGSSTSPTPDDSGSGSGYGDSGGGGSTSDYEDEEVPEIGIGGGSGLPTIGDGSSGAGSIVDSILGRGDEEMASPGYLRAATILTNTYGNDYVEEQPSINVQDLIDGTPDDVKSLDVTLVNGASGNSITPQMLKSLKDKGITLNIAMVQPSDNTTIVARWTVLGPSLENVDSTFNPNITFEVTDKDTDRLLYFATASPEYTAGYELSVYPASDTYGSGELVRMYACDTSKANSKLLQAFTWQDGVNVIPIDIYTNTRFALTNALDAYPDGSILLDVSDIEIPIEEEEFEWDEENTEEPVFGEPSPSKKKIPTWFFIVAGIILLVVIAVVVLLILRNKASRSNANYDSGEEYADSGVDVGDYSSPEGYSYDQLIDSYQPTEGYSYEQQIDVYTYEEDNSN